RSARIANIAQMTRAIQPAADGEVLIGSSRPEARPGRGASYTWELRGNGIGEGCHLAGDAAHERPAERCYDDVTTTGVAFHASKAARVRASTARSTVPPARRSRPIRAAPTTGGEPRRLTRASGTAAVIRVR